MCVGLERCYAHALCTDFTADSIQHILFECNSGDIMNPAMEQGIQYTPRGIRYKDEQYGNGSQNEVHSKCIQL